MKEAENKAAIKVGIVSLGCAKNLVDSELMLGRLAQDGFAIVNDEQEADIIIVNTCAFIEEAREEAINTILEMAEYKKQNCKALVVAGCLAQRYPEEIKKELPEVDAIVGINSVEEIAEIARKVAADNSERPEVALSENYSADYINGPRILSTPEGSAYLKIAEGCDNRCSFCAIPYIRGRLRSRRIEDVVAEAENLAAEGVKELDLIAQDSTRYGLDLYGKKSLPDLLRRLEAVDGIELIRILYLYPDEIDDELIDVLARSKKIARYIDLPLQHISDRLLKKMNRRGTAADIKAVIARLREAIPECIFRTSFIVGFPGETEQDFEELMKFVSDNSFDRVGVFKYSPEEGTPAARMKDQLSEEVKQERYDALYSLAQKISLRQGRKRVGKTVRVLTEGVSDDGIFYFGRSYAEAPDSDGKIYFTSEKELEPGDMVNVKLLIAEEYDLTGTAVEDPAEDAAEDPAED